MAFATRPPGPGLDPDAASYVGAAVSLVRTGLYRVPSSGWSATDTTEALAHFPPGFPTAIALPIALGAAPVQAARIVIAISAFVTAAVIAALADTVGLGLLAVAVVFLTPAIIDMHLSVLSEPLFLALLVSVLALMVASVERPAWWLRAALGVLAAGALMVRYAGAGVVAAAVIWVVIQRVPWRQRVRDLVITGVPAAVVLGVWVAHATRRAGDTGIRRFAVYGHLGASLRVGASTLGDWLAPGLSAPALRVVVAIVVAVMALAAVWGAWRHTRPIIAAAALLIVCLTAVVVASRLLADPNIPFDERILAPTIVLAEIVVVGGLVYAPRSARVVLGAWWLAAAAVSIAAVRAALDDGNDFASSDWRFSPTVEWVRDSANGRTIYTNWPVALYFQAGRNSHSLPSVLEPLTLRRFGDRLARTRGLLVAFDTPSPDAAPPDSMASRLRLRSVARLSDGAVWEAP